MLHHATCQQHRATGQQFKHCVRRFDPARDALPIAQLWKQVLLQGGLTSYGTNYNPERSEEYASAAVTRLCKAHARKAAAASRARALQHGLLNGSSSSSCKNMPSSIIPRSNRPSSESSITEDVVVQQMSPKLQFGQDSSSLWRMPLAGMGHAKRSSASRDQDAKIRKELGRLRRSRMWACLVAETVAMDCSSGSSSSSNMDEQRSSGGSRGCGKQLSGYLLMSLSQPLALLPPPFPSTTPLVMHIDGVAVGEHHRRQGVARALLQAAERLARRWGRASLWLEAAADNTPALELYRSAGYTAVRSLGWPWRSHKQVTLCKLLRPVGAKQTAGAAASEEDAGLGVGLGVGGEQAASKGMENWSRGHAAAGEAALSMAGETSEEGGRGLGGTADSRRAEQAEAECRGAAGRTKGTYVWGSEDD